MRDEQTRFLEDTKKQIEALAEIRRRGGVKAYYLAQLGADLGASRQRLEEITGQKLVDFVVSECKFKVGSSDKRRTGLYIYFGDRDPNIIKRVRYAKPFWDAFATPLGGETDRYLDLDTFKFGAQAEVSAGAGAVREISPRYIVSGESKGVADLISEKIRAWLEDQGLDPKDFADPR